MQDFINIVMCEYKYAFCYGIEKKVKIFSRLL